MSFVKTDRDNLASRRLPSSHSVAHSIAHFPLLIIREARGAVLIVYLLRSVSGTLIAPWAYTPQLLAQLTLGVISMLFAVACVYLYNGLTDIEQDRVNGSDRPLATNRLTPAQVQYTIIALVAIDIAIGFYVPLGASICNAGMIILGAIYSGGRYPAKMHGTAALLVAGMGATLPYLSTGLIAAGALQSKLVATAVLLGVWVWAGGAAKDLSDVRGDAAAGRVTLPVRVGERRARRAIARRLVCTAAAATVLCGLGIAAPALLLMPACAAVLAVLSHRAPQGGDRHSMRRLYRAFMWSQYTLNGALLLLSVVP